MKKLLLSAAVSATLAFAGAAMAALPNVSILATGGTIAGSAASNTQMTGYKAGSIGIQTLINAVPAMKQYANISGEQICNIARHGHARRDGLFPEPHRQERQARGARWRHASRNGHFR